MNLLNPLAALKLLFTGAGSGSVKVNLRTGEVFQVNSLLDLWVIKETVIDRQYEVASVPLQMDWVVVDIGAAMGDYTVWAASQLTNGRVIAVEPFPDSMRNLEQNLLLNRVRNVLTFEKAVSGTGGIKELNLIGSSSVLHSTVAENNSKYKHTVSSLSLSDLLDQSGIDRCDYLKMDCEGEEYDILFQVNSGVLSRIDRICMEVHDNMTRYSRQDMQDFLVKHGYQVRLTFNPVHDSLAILYAYRAGTKV